MKEFYGKKGIVTGAASGIGKALVLELASRGAEVFMVDLDLDQLNQIADDYRGRFKLHVFQMDVSDHSRWQDLISRFKSNCISLDFIFNNAGISIDGEMKDMTISLWDKILDVNLKGVIYGSHEAYQLMLEQGYGHIVNISSLSGLIPGWMQVAYSTTKWGVLGFTKSMRPEAAMYGIKVTVACPGMVETNIFQNTTLLNISREDFVNQLAFKRMPVDKAAKIIVNGMLENKAEIVFPFHAKALKNFYRFFPGTFDKLGKKESLKFKKLIRPLPLQDN